MLVDDQEPAVAATMESKPPRARSRGAGGEKQAQRALPSARNVDGDVWHWAAKNIRREVVYKQGKSGRATFGGSVDIVERQEEFNKAAVENGGGIHPGRVA